MPQATGHIGDWVLIGPPNDVITYQPADRFWPFQFIEAGIFVALTEIDCKVQPSAPCRSGALCQTSGSEDS